MEPTSEVPVNEYPPRRLVRRNERRLIAGVATGLGDYFAVSPWFVRAAFVAITFVHGIGAFLYVAAIVLLPLETDPPGVSPTERFVRRNFRRHDRTQLLTLGVLVFAVAFIVSHSDHRAIVWALLLLAFGAFLLHDKTVEPLAEAPLVSAAPKSESTITTPAYGQSSPPWVRARSAGRMREHSVLALLTIGAGILAFGAAIGLAENSVVSLSVQQVLAFPMIVLGVGLLVGVWVGRSRVLIVPALLLLPVLVAASVADVPFSARVGVNHYNPTSGVEIRHDYALGAGRLILDLSQVPVNTTSVPIDVHVGAGQIVVIVPKDIPLAIDATAGAGRVEVLGRSNDGTFPHVVTHTQGQGVELQLKARVGFGQVFVTDNPNAMEARR